MAVAQGFEFSPTQLAFLNSHKVAHLATADRAGTPNVVPVCFAALLGAIFIAIDEKPKRKQPASLKRVSNIVANPMVSFVADRYDDEWSELAWLQVQGRAELVTDPSIQVEALRALRERYHQYRSMDLESRPLIRITPMRINSWSINGSL